MSYILEALKKAQAERQIGSAPTIHAATLGGLPAGQGARSKRTPVIVAMVLMATAIAGLGAMLLRQSPSAGSIPANAAGQPPVAAATAPAAQASPAPEAQAAPVPVAQAGQVARAPAAPFQIASATRTEAPPVAANPVAPTAASSVAPAIAAGRASLPPAALAQSAPRSPAQRGDLQPAARPAPVAVAAAQPRAADAIATPSIQPAPPAPAPVEEQVQSLRDLPEPIQRAIPQITLGGYMYSKNPADRLLLIDKVLRREGEEVAPGLILEKLQPKQAIFGFRGYRYRIAL